MTSPITVLHARIVTGAGGGPDKTILNSPRHLADTRYRALAAYLHPPNDPGFVELERRAAELECPLFAFPESLPIDPLVIRRLAKLCRAEGVRIWHGHDHKSNLYGLLLRRRLGLKLVTTVHGWVQQTKRTPLHFALDRQCIKRYDQVVCVSQDLFERCRDELGVPAERLTRIDNAIDTARFARRTSPSDAAVRTELGTPASRLVIGAVGRLSKEKGFDLLIEAVDELIHEGLDIELWIAGDGDESAALEEQRAGLRHPERCCLLGFQPDTQALFEAFDLFCLSSLREGLPNVVLEAMSMGVPVLATRSGGMQAFARDGEDALLCDPGSTGELTNGLRKLVLDPELRVRLRSAARKRVVAELGFARRMESMVAVYDRLGV